MSFDRFKHNLLAERINEIGVICRTQFDHLAWRVWEELDFAVALLEGKRLDEAEVHCEKAERKLVAERRRVLERRRLHDLIGRWQLRIPRGLHPSGRTWIDEYLVKMRTVADYSLAGEIAPHEAEQEIARLADLIRKCVVRELLFNAEDAETFGDHKDAYRLRRQAERFERIPYAQVQI